MRTVNIQIYKFEELSKEAKENAISIIGESYHNDNEFAEWAIDDCGLLEPPHEELDKLFKEDYNFPLIKNNRKVFFDTYQRTLDISKAMEIQNSTQFLMWLGLTKRLIEKVDYDILEDTIDFKKSKSFRVHSFRRKKIKFSN